MRCVIGLDDMIFHLPTLNFLGIRMVGIYGGIGFLVAFCSDASDTSVKSSLALDPQKPFSWILGCPWYLVNGL